VFAKPSILIRRELKHGDISTLTNNDLSLIRHNIHRARSTIHPSLPKSAMETHAILEFMNYTTNDNEQFILFANNSGSSTIGFSTERNLNVYVTSQTFIWMELLMSALSTLLNFLPFMDLKVTYIYHLYFSCYSTNKRSFTS
jgi:hypothetical protein